MGFKSLLQYWFAGLLFFSSSFIAYSTVEDRLGHDHGALDKKHDQAAQEFVVRYFKENGVFSRKKIEAFLHRLEEEKRILGDAQLQTNINNEAKSRSDADDILQTNIDNEETARIAGDVQLPKHDT